MKACKHLDYENEYINCDLKQLDGFSCNVKYWHRNNLMYEDAPKKVQFCGQGRGRINSIFACYNDDEMSCYEPDDT